MLLQSCAHHLHLLLLLLPSLSANRWVARDGEVKSPKMALSNPKTTHLSSQRDLVRECRTFTNWQGYIIYAQTDTYFVIIALQEIRGK